MLSNTKPTAAELRVMRAEAERVRAELHEGQESAPVVELPQPVQLTAVSA